jgi:voltage-gated potassium channel
MFLCVMISVGTIWYESPYNHFIIWGTWGIFLIDYVTRLISSNDKVQFIKRHPFDLVAIIPLDALFQTAKLARLYRLIRIKTIAKHYSNPLINKVMENKVPYVLSVSFFVILLATLPFYYYEPLVKTFEQAFRWSIASFLFFGNSNATPETWIGKVVIILLTIIGVIIHSVIMAITIRFLSKKIDKKGTKKVLSKIRKQSKLL